MDIINNMPIILKILILSLIELGFIIMYWECGGDDLEFFNPLRNYEEWDSMNWFGVILFTTLLNILFPAYSLAYWFWKLCTVGRK